MPVSRQLSGVINLFSNIINQGPFLPAWCDFNHNKYKYHMLSNAWIEITYRYLNVETAGLKFLN